MRKNTVKKQKKRKKKEQKRKKKALKKKNRGTRYFTRTKNVMASIYFLLMITIAMIILLTLLGILEI